MKKKKDKNGLSKLAVDLVLTPEITIPILVAKILLGLLAIIVVVTVIAVFITEADNAMTDIVKKYNTVGSLKASGNGDGNKKLNFLVSYYSQTKDLTLSLQLGNKGQDSQMSQAGGDSSTDPDPGGTGGNGGWDGTWDIDGLAAVLKSAGAPEAKVKYLAYAYFYFKDKDSTEYTDEVCSAIIGNMIIEGNPGLIESLQYTNRPPPNCTAPPWYKHTCLVDGKSFYTHPSHVSAGYCKSGEICVHSIDGTHLDSKEKLEYLQSIGDSPNQPGIGMVQWSGGRRSRLLEVYKTSGLDYTNQDNQAFIEVQYVDVEAHSNESSAFNRIKGSTGGLDKAKECGYLWRKYFERPGSDAECKRAEGTAALVYNAIQSYNSR